jgi:hypothetical protein
MLDIYLRKLAKSKEMLNLFVALKDMKCFKLFNNEKDLSKLQSIFLSYLYFYHNLNLDISAKRVSEKVLEDEIYENAYAHYRNNEKEEIDNNNSTKKKTIQGVFSKDNKIKFSKEVK